MAARGTCPWDEHKCDGKCQQKLTAVPAMERAGGAAAAG
jgi:hypothetical protein